MSARSTPLAAAAFNDGVPHAPALSRASCTRAFLRSALHAATAGAGEGGLADLYVAAIMFGCIPVMLNSSHWRMALPHALPLEEVLHWER